MKKLLLFAVLATPAFSQFFGGGNASKIRGINVLGPLTVSDGCALVYVAASTRFECGAGSGGGTGNGIVAVTVSAATSATLTHNAALATPYIAPFVCREDTTNLPVIPATTTFTTNAIAFTFSPAFTGKCAASTGGSGISGSIATGQICYGSASNTCAGSAGLTFSDAANVSLATLAGGSSQSTNPLLDVTNSAGSSHWLTVLGDGKVGVGTNAPGSRLVVDGASAVTVLTIQSTANTGVEMGLKINNSGSPVAQLTANSGNGQVTIGGTSAAYFTSIYAGGTERIRLLTGGAVGIGTSNIPASTATLSVLDATPSTGSTATWIGHDGSGTYSGAHLSALTTSLKVVAGLTQGSTNLQEWRNNAGTVVASYGSPAANVNALTLIEGSSQSGKPLVLFGASGGAGDIGLARADVATLRVTDSAGTIKSFSALNSYINGGSDGQFNSTGVRVRSDVAGFQFSATTNATGAADTNLSRIAPGGIVGVGTGAAGSVAGTIQAAKYIGALTTPASAAATCTAGTIVADTGFVYVCTATDTWKRVAIATW